MPISAGRSVFSERSRSLYAVARPSVVSLHDVHEKLYGDCPMGTSPSRGLNARGVAKYSDVGPIECYISETVQDRRLLITNRKSYMSFRLVPKSVALNDLQWRNGRYFALFHRIRVRCLSKAITGTSASKSTVDSLYDLRNYSAILWAKQTLITRFDGHRFVYD